MSDLIGLAVLFIFLGVLFAFANIADREYERGESGRAWAAITYGVLILFYGLAAVVGLGIWLFSTLAQANPELLQQTQIGGQPNPLEMFANPALFGMGLAIPSLVGMLLLLPPVRKLVALFTKIDARSTVHALALSISMLVLVQIGILLGMGMENIAEAVTQNSENGASSAMQLVTMWAQQLLSAALGIVGVGFLIRRDWGETRARLGLVVPTLRQVAMAVGLSVVLVVLVVVLGGLAQQYNFGVDENVDKLSEVLMGALFESPWGILTAGLSAAIGEEILIRGALQPRFGILLSTVIFALLHGQYGLTLSTLIVFLVGLVLGIVRNRENTSTSMMIHALYNMALSTMTYLGLEMLK